jgi:hypothetical protein
VPLPRAVVEAVRDGGEVGRGEAAKVGLLREVLAEQPLVFSVVGRSQGRRDAPMACGDVARWNRLSASSVFLHAGTVLGSVP